MEKMSLENKACWFEDYIQKYMIDKNGVVYSRLNVDTNRPLVDHDIQPGSELLPAGDFSISEILNYENSGMTTGAYLAAMVYKYRVTKDLESLQKAAFAFEGLRWIYNLGLQEKEGFFPKTYGGKISEQVSSDQYLYAMKAMMAYRQIACIDHVKQIERMIPKMADFWIDCDYKRTYFSIKDMQWPLGRFPCFAIMAYVVSGEQKYLDEFNRLNEEFKVYKKPWESQIYNRKQDSPDVFNDYEKSQGNKYLLGYLGESAVMDIMELDECLQHSDAHVDDWLRVMRIMWNEGKVMQADNGYSYSKVLYDPQTGKVTIPQPGYVGPVGELKWSFVSWAGKMYMPRSTMFARVGVNIAKWLPDEDGPAWTRKILEGIQVDMITDYIPADENQIEDKHKFLNKLVCGDSICNWLWAYWQGLYEGVLVLEGEN